MKVYGLIGYPLIQSFSKKYFTHKFQQEAIPDCLFELFPLRSITEFEELITSQPNLRGLAVTIPYKESVIPFLTALDGESKIIGAVNCISIDGKILTGFNTDVTGFEKSLQPLLKSHHTHALVLGTGGASKAVQFVLKKIGIKFLLVSRKERNEAGYITYSGIDEDIMRSHSLVINCTPVGMVPDEQHFPSIPYRYIHEQHLLYDLVYKPEQTLFLKKGREQGAVIKNGYEMLLIQAEENWRIWNS